ncbi:MAG: mechanosensitive ion channel family protein [Desulforhopalus sp.]
MSWKTIISLLFLLVFFPVSSLSQVGNGEKTFEEAAAEITEFSKLIEQIDQEKKGAKGTEARALAKQLLLAREFYRGLLWNFVDDLEQGENKGEFSGFASSHLLAESVALKKEVEKNIVASTELEEQITSGWMNYSKSGQAKLDALKSKLSKKHKALEKLYTALVKNGQKLAIMGEDASQDFAYAKPLVTRQANILSGQIGLETDKLNALERKLSAVSSESSTGKKLLDDIRAQTLLIKNEARRLQNMALLLDILKIDASIYKKRVIQSMGSFSSGIFDRKVVSHLFTEWWLQTKKWFSKQAPELLGKMVTFIIIILLAFLVASVVKKMMRRVFRRTLPDMSELAKNFIVSMSSKLLILAGLLLALSNMGVQIGPLLAGLGIMGFVIGFALQDTLSNFASGMMILVYRPYDVGDKIKSAGVKGKVSKMNLVSTTIYTSENHQLTVPNKKIWGDIIHNVTSQPQQRIDLYFRVPFSADSEKVRSAIADVVETCPHVIEDKAKSVRIHELGETDVRYLARFWVATDDLNEAQWTISEGVKKRFDEEGISLTIVESARS